MTYRLFLNLRWVNHWVLCIGNNRILNLVIGIKIHWTIIDDLPVAQKLNITSFGPIAELASITYKERGERWAAEQPRERWAVAHTYREPRAAGVVAAIPCQTGGSATVLISHSLLSYTEVFSSFALKITTNKVIQYWIISKISNHIVSTPLVQQRACR